MGENLIQNALSFQGPLPYPSQIRRTGDTLKGFLFLDILHGNSFGTKPAVLYFKAENINGDWKFTHFGRLQIMESLNHEDGLPYPEDSIRNRGDIVITVD